MGSDYAALLTNLFLYSNKAGLISLFLKKNHKIQPALSFHVHYTDDVFSPNNFKNVTSAATNMNNTEPRIPSSYIFCQLKLWSPSGQTWLTATIQQHQFCNGW
jgi:hypothetical protein